MKYNTVICLILMSATLMWGQAKGLKNAQISIFKDGSSFVLKRGKVQVVNGKYKLFGEDIPQALFGTFWFQNPDLLHVVSGSDSTQQVVVSVATNMYDLLKVNTGKQVTLFLLGQKGEIISGTVEGVYENAVGAVSQSGLPSLFMVEIKQTSGKWMTLRSSEIDRIEFESKPNSRTETKTTKVEPTLTLEFSGNQSEQPLDMMYLQKGLTWYPMYQLEILGDDKARLQLVAEVVNQAEDIENTEVNMVVGVPNFRFATQPSNLVRLVSRVFNNYGSYGVLPGMSFMNSQITSDNIAVSNEGYSGNGGGFSNSIEPTEVEDLFFYSLKNFSLKLGSVGQFHVFSHDIPIEHVYECNLQNNVGFTTQAQTYNFDQPEKNHVYHSLRLTNNSPTPWTTAPTMIVKTDHGKKLPLGQDLLNFTSKKANSYLKLTETPEVLIKQTEKEVARQQRVRTHYDLVTIEATITVKNYKPNTTKINLRRLIYGDLIKSEQTWIPTAIVVPQINYINYACNNVLWEFDVESGKEKTFKYTYQILVYTPY